MLRSAFFNAGGTVGSFCEILLLVVMVMVLLHCCFGLFLLFNVCLFVCLCPVIKQLKFEFCEDQCFVLFLKINPPTLTT